MDVSAEWLAKRAPGFADLLAEERNAIFEFAFLWSLFEAKVMDERAQADRIRDKIDVWAEVGKLYADQFQGELSYFRDRYFANGELTHHFPFLNLRNGDHPELVQAVIEGTNTDPRDRMLALLMIVWRLRNNLFHGAKWAYGLRGQLENFKHANSVLMRLLDHHGQLP
jgi:hypothetical protein